MSDPSLWHRSSDGQCRALLTEWEEAGRRRFRMSDTSQEGASESGNLLGSTASVVLVQASQGFRPRFVVTKETQEITQANQTLCCTTGGLFQSLKV